MAEQREGGYRGGRYGGRDGGDRNLPGVPKPPQAPDRSTFEGKLRKKRDEVNKIRTRLQEIQDKLNNRESDPARDAYYEQQRQLTAQMRAAQDTIREEREKRSDITRTMRETRQLREDLESKMQTLTGELGAFKDLDEIAHAIGHIEKKLETEGSGSLKQEKEFLRRRKLLESAKDQIKQLEPLRGQIELCSDKELDSIKEAKVIQARMDQLNTQLRETAEQKASIVLPTKSRDEAKALRAERDDLRQKVSKCHEDMDGYRAEFKEEEAIFKKKMDAWREVLEAAKVEREKERKKRDEERAKKAAELAEIRKLNPYEAEIDLCNTLIRYLEDKLHLGRAQPKRVVEPRVDTTTLNVLKKTQAEDNDWLFQDRRKAQGMGKANSRPKDKNAPAKAATGKENVPKDAPIKLDIHRLLSFERLGIEAPHTTSQATKTLQVLKDKKKHFETFVRDEEEVAAETAKEKAEAEAEAAMKAEEEAQKEEEQKEEPNGVEEGEAAKVEAVA